MKNKVGIYYAYWTHEWDVDFNPFIDKVVNLGFDILEVNGGTFANLSKNERQKLIDHARSNNIELSYCIGLSKKYNVASPDELTRKRGINFLLTQIKSVGEMKGSVLSGIIYGCWPAIMPMGSMKRQDYLELSINSLRNVIRVAEDNGVVLCIEIVNRFEQFLLNTAIEGVEFCKAVNSPNIKILLDTFHMNIEEDSIASAIQIAGNYLGHVHLGENHRMLPGCGHGHIPWDEVFTSLKKINYMGALVMEPFLKPGGQVGRDIKIWRDQSNGFDLDNEARKSCSFVKDRLLAAE